MFQDLILHLMGINGISQAKSWRNSSLPVRFDADFPI